MTAKRKAGRPQNFGVVTERRTVHLPPEVVAKLIAYGDGSLSRGIVKAAKKVKP
jgi:hypothetical protein